jgi:hypothetical protein
VFVRGLFGDLLSTWEQPLLVRHVDGLARNGRVAGLVLFDPLVCGTANCS